MKQDEIERKESPDTSTIYEKISLKFLAAIECELGHLGDLIAKLKTSEDSKNKGEAIANAMLAYRHLEDCASRLAKVTA